ncbi:MAG: hypothetical protein R3Y44_06990 [Rikenellaceae bacterium]
MRSIRFILITLLSLIANTLSAQEQSDYRFEDWLTDDPKESVIEVDTTLFRMPITHSTDAYAQATRYYRIQGASRRRGLYYTTAEQIIEPAKSYLQTLEEPFEVSQIAIYTAQSNYRVGLRAAHSQMLNSGWSYASSLWSQTGRDSFVEGVFRNTLSPKVTINKRFDDNHFLTIDAELYYSMRGLQYGATPEAFELTGSNFYNPAWGFYDGKVRNSRVRRDFNPHLTLHYQRALGDQTTLIIEGDANYSRRANSSLGWYNATTPMPDYYRKMPSFMPEGQIKEYITNLWRTADTNYTQVNWDEMIRLNSLSSDGNAFYTLEDRVERGVSTSITALAHTVTSNRVTIIYGIEGEINGHRYFKKMRDLLGATHLTDYDVFIGDSYNKTTPLQNNLLQPDNYITEGDRFGYDYSQYQSSLNALLKIQYRARRVDFDIEATIGEEAFHRVGHFEKERFPLSASLGESSIIELSPYTIRASVGYAVEANRYFALKLISSRLSPLSRNLFLNEMSANYLAPSLEGETINSAACAFRFNYPIVSISGEIYALRSRNGSSVYSLYDDLTSTMCRASISEIGYSSYGIELTADFRLHSDLKCSTTLAAGKYYYDTNPSIELFDDYNLFSISAATTSRMSGVNIGNAPQIAATASATYFGISRYILSLSSSYAALRYEQPSIARRSERLLAQAFINEESATAALKQQRLDDIFDVEVSASRFIWFDNGGRLMLKGSIRNLLGYKNRIIYAKESDRITLQSVDDYFSGSTLREGLYQYGSPRTIQLSVSYQF